MVEYLSKLSNAIFEMKRDGHERRTTDMIKKIHLYIENNMSKDISLVKLADTVNLNPSYLSRLYKQVTHTTLSDYIDGVRIQKAKDLLKSSELKINENSGTYRLRQFILFLPVFFKKLTGITPQNIGQCK